MLKALGLIALGASGVYGNAIDLASLNTSVDATQTVTGLATITSAPSLSNAIAINTSSYFNQTANQTFWDDPYCYMFAGTVDLVFWPTNDNVSRPSTFYDTKVDFTYSSPSVYMVVNTLYGWNKCGPLGPPTSREIFGFDLTDVSTLAPYSDRTETTKRETKQLELSDLGTHCTASFNTSELATQKHPIDDDDTRCNPFLAVPMDIKRWGYPYWKHCGIANNKFGLFDPPYAIPAVDNLLPVASTTSDQVHLDSQTAAASASTKATAASNPVPTGDDSTLQQAVPITSTDVLH